MNWYDSLFGVQAFEANHLPHHDPYGWLKSNFVSERVLNERKALSTNIQDNTDNKY